MNGSVRQLVLVGVVLGVVCAGLVWWLERFELARLRELLAEEAQGYLEKVESFRRWQSEHGDLPG